ncbi:MAG TPA: TetR/AcrR family transcriptional regulator [Solirubrobacterales bacterium]|nr:TetR/AcrR family transcriptional regulator [Solirubrobacterales bacterium]
MEQGGTRRDAIVEAMIRVAGSKGYLAVSVADVITEANVSRTTFYKHFSDKQGAFSPPMTEPSRRSSERPKPLAKAGAAGATGRGAGLLP